jgi:aspartyl/asparaginyl beta-hydroxylase (cupin superfamily)
MKFWEDKIKETPVLIDLLKNWREIKKEVLDLISDPNFLHDYPKWDKAGGVDELYDYYWKVCPLSNFDHEYTANRMTPEQKEYARFVISNARSRCPTISKCIGDLENQGNLASAFISRLIPGSVINPHHGYTKEWMRVHLGLVCDPDCKITVGDVGSETKTWEEGKLLAFWDGQLHSVRHDGKKERIVLSVDIKYSYLIQFIK